MANSKSLSQDDWDAATNLLPIASVDVLPVNRTGSGHLRIGLIRRTTPFGDTSDSERWCHVGGRVELDEPLLDAAKRELAAALVSTENFAICATSFMVNEFFRDEGMGAGWDPRKHTVAACYLAELTEPGPEPATHGSEALEFRWFSIEALNALPDDALWPGTKAMICRAEEILSHSRDLDLVSYDILGKERVLFNQLLWQSPALAVTAISFLMTIALTQSDERIRAVAALLSALVALISAQLLAKHSTYEKYTSIALEQIERRRGMLLLHPKPRYGDVRLRDGITAKLADRQSRRWWLVALLIFGVVSMILFVIFASTFLVEVFH